MTPRRSAAIGHEISATPIKTGPGLVRDQYDRPPVRVRTRVDADLEDRHLPF
jgi:hypothetical protein